jgi:hypothetical protein
MIKVGDLLGVALILVGLYIFVDVLTNPKTILLQLLGLSGSLILIIVESVFIFEKLKGGL